MGDEKYYIERQWGDLKSFVPDSSFPKQSVWEYGYDPSKVMEDLVPADCDVQVMSYPLSDTDIKDLAPSYDLVFQTFATKESKEHQPPLVQFMVAAKLGNSDPSKNFVVYNGDKDDNIIVREAQLFGNHFLEFPKGINQEQILSHWPMDMTGYKVSMLKDLDPRTKPWQQPKGNIRLIGRWAQWDRKILSHHAYAIAQQMIGEL
jgi:hypothetical protein